MYLTTKEVLDLKQEVQKDLDDFNDEGKKYVYVIQGEERITLLYVVELLNKILQMLHKGNYIKSELLGALKEQDWIRYSFSSNSLWKEDKLRDRLGIKSKKAKVSDLLWKQAEYLEQASWYIITRLD